MLYRQASLFLMLLLFTLASCASHRPEQAFETVATPSAPNYSQSSAWAALPDKADFADGVPNKDLEDLQAKSQVDVFFIHPTSFSGKTGNKGWNGDLANAALNKRTDEGAIQYQASVFNGSAKVYAPRYRQAHLHAYFSEDTTSAKKAFDVAYSDVKAAFEYYLKHYNNKRPIIIAAHSQGVTHSKRLIKEFFDGKPLQNRLVVAYIVGLPVLKKEFKTIKPCDTPTETGCFCTWRTWKTDTYPAVKGDMIAVTNPLSWTTDTELVPATKNEGALFPPFNGGTRPNAVSAQVSHGVLWSNKPKFKGSWLVRSPNYHIGDYNLYWLSIRKNVATRIGAYWK